MGDKGQMNTQESTREMLQALSQYAPDAIKAINSTVAGTAEAQQAASEAVSPRAAQQQIDLYKKYGPEANKIGSELDRQNQLAASGNELAIAQGPGENLVKEADKLQKITDPEFYKNRATLGAKMDQWLNARDPSKLTDTEQEEIARGLGRSPNANVTSAANTLKNASAFGSAADKKWNDFGTAISSAAQALPQLKQGSNAFEIATRRAIGQNSGDKRLTGPQDTSGATQNNFGFANNTLNQIGANQRQSESMRTSVLDDVLTGTKAFANVAQGAAAFA